MFFAFQKAESPAFTHFEHHEAVLYSQMQKDELYYNQQKNKKQKRFKEDKL